MNSRSFHLTGRLFAGMALILTLSLLASCGILLPVDLGSASADVTVPDLRIVETAESEETYEEPDETDPYTLYALPAEFISERPHRVDVRTLQTAEVERVVDGDTLVIVLDGQRDRLRMLGINAPESSSNPDESRQTSEGDIVSGIVKELLPGRTIYLEFDEAPRDQYERLLAYVWLDEDTMLNENLVFSGLVTVVRFPPNTAYYDYFRTLNRAARAENLGFYKSVWSD